MRSRLIQFVSAATLAASAAALLLSCHATAAGTGELAAAVGPRLPPLSALDGLRGASALAGWPARVQEPVDLAHAAPVGAGLFLKAPANEIAYAIYRIAEPSGTPLTVQASGSGLLWLVAADYADSRWEQPTLLQAGTAQADLTALGNPVSPDGFIYCAVVCAPGAAGLLDSLVLNYDATTAERLVYVAPGGHDDGAGTELDPWATLQHAADAVQPGDTVIVRPGGYAGFHLQTSGAPGAPVRFKADPGVQITADNPNTPDGINIEDWSSTGIGYVEISGFTVAGRTRTGIRVAGTDVSPAHHISIRGSSCDANGRWGILTGFVDDMLIEGNTCTDSAAEHGIYFGNSGDRVTLRGNTCAHNHGCGIHMNGDASLGGDGIISGALVEGNTIFDNGASGGSGINCDGVQQSTIRNNLLYGNHAGGISLYHIDAGDGARDNAVLNNTIVMADDGRWCLNLASDSTGTLAFNNVLYNNHAFHGSITLATSPLSGFTSDYNAVMDRLTPDDGSSVLTLAQWRAATGQDAHSLVATPQEMFADPAGDDYTPAALSPLRDSAFALYAPALDVAGTLRPQQGSFDIGAFEGL
jgi:hypothetical protein